MTEYIEREATIELLQSLGSRDYRREKGTIQEAIKMVSFPEYTPSADVAPVRHGRWEEADDGDGVVCSLCGTDFCTLINDTDTFLYCPNCGAKMDAI